MNVGIVFAVAGLLACALLMIVLSFAEAAHPRRPARSREPVIEAPALSPEPEHGVHGALPAVVPPPDVLPPGRNNTLEEANRIAARSRRSWHPEFYNIRPQIAAVLAAPKSAQDLAPIFEAVSPTGLRRP